MSQVPGVDETTLRVASYALLAVALVVSLAVLTRLSDGENLVGRLRERFVYGVPWGTVVVVAAVYSFYYLVQGGGQSGGPIVTGFRSWSLWAPQTMLFSSFAHASESHLIGNLFGTLAFAPLVEYAWGHYPRGEETEGIPHLLWTPPARIGAFVAGVFLTGLLGSLIVPGAVIGFSGVVFAFAGVAVVTLPIRTTLAILGIGAIRLLWDAFRNPWLVAEGGPQFVRPGWANVALQGHLFGLVVGVLVGVGLLRLRSESPNLRHVYFAALVFAITRSMDAVYWFLGNETYILFTGFGAAAVLLLASLIAAAAYEGDWELVPRIDLRLRTAAGGFLIALLVALALVGLPYNLASVDGGDELQNSIEVRDYEVTYAENVSNRYIGGPDLPVYRGPEVRQSGVIVASDDRNIWELSTSAQQLAFDGETTVVLGDATWRETVYINRTEWRVTGGNATYKVYGSREGDPRRLLFASDPAIADPVVNNSRVAIRPTNDFYEIVVTRNGTVLGTRAIPPNGQQVVLGGITFQRDGTALLVRTEGTAFRIAAYRSGGR